MARMLAAAVLLLGLFSNALADTVEPNHRVSNSLNIREAPTSESTVLRPLAPGYSLPYLRSVPYYHEVDLGGGRKGYASKSHSRIIRSAPPTVSTQGELKLHFMDVGQGDSTLISCPDGKHILVDAGSAAHYPGDEVRGYLLDVFKDQDLIIDDLIVTHPDQDHYNKLPELLQGFTVSQIWWTGSKEQYLIKSARDWLFDEKQIELIHLKEGDHSPQTTPASRLECGEADVYVLSAGLNKGRSDWRKNTISIVVMIRYGDFEAVLTGDATTVTEKAILERYDTDWLDVDLLKIGHHGSRTTSTSSTWADTLSPEISVVSAGATNSHGHPSQEVIERLESHAVSSVAHSITSASGKRGSYQWHSDDQYVEAIYNTTTSGTVVVSSDGVGWQVSKTAP